MKNLKDTNEKLTKWLSDNIIIVYLIFILLILLLPLLFTRFSIISFGNQPNEIGDAINGLTAPVIGSFSVLLVYLAFKSQLDANEKLNLANIELLKISKDQFYVTEFQMLKAKLEYIKTHYDVSFIFEFSKKVSEWEIAKDNIEIGNLLKKSINHLNKFKDYKTLNMTRTIKILSIYRKQLLISNLNDEDKEFLGIECNRLNYIKNNIELYKIHTDVNQQLSEHKLALLLNKHNHIITYIKILDF